MCGANFKTREINAMTSNAFFELKKNIFFVPFAKQSSVSAEQEDLGEKFAKSSEFSSAAECLLIRRGSALALEKNRTVAIIISISISWLQDNDSKKKC